MKSNRTRHIFIVGQTASGKTGLSLKLAKDLDAEILNTDSLMFYKDLSIGTAKPSKEELLTVPHHMVDICDVGEDINASDYSEKAHDILSNNKKNFLCVGGSGFYIDALDKGLLPLPQTDQAIVEEVNALGDPVEFLKDVDPETLKTISEEDLYRVKRALQVYCQTGKPLSQWKKENVLKPYAKKIALHIERDQLLERVKLRVDMMFEEESLIEEVKRALEDNKSEGWRPLSSVGYKQTLDYLNGGYSSLEEVKADIVTKTMQLAKRQKTWFKKDPTVKWFSFNDDYSVIKDYVMDLWETEKWRV